MRAIQSPFDFHLRSTKPCADFFPGHPPAISIPTHGVIVGYLARGAHAQDFFQTLFAPQPSMCIAGMTCYHRKTPLPLRKKTYFQKAIRRFDPSDSRQTHFLHQTVLQGLEEPFDATFGLRTLRGDPFDP